MADPRDALFRPQYERDAAGAPSFAARMRARDWLFSRGWGEDPWSEASLFAELDRAAQQGFSAALEDAGRALLANEHFEPLTAWLDRATPETAQDREAVAVVRGLIAIRGGDNEAASALLTDLPMEEAVALHGLALLQLGRPADAAARLEVLLAANALNDDGELPARFLPESMPVLGLFLTACTTAATRLLAQAKRAEAEPYALAARDAYRRYAQAEPAGAPSRDDVVALLKRVAPPS